MPENKEPYIPLEPFLKDLANLYEWKSKESFTDFFIEALATIDNLAETFAFEELIALRKQFYAFGKFFIPVESLAKIIAKTYNINKKMSNL